MHALTAQIVELEDTPNINKCFLEENYSGGGVLSELMCNKGTRQANVIRVDGTMEYVSIPVANFMAIGDTITVVRDTDGCELYYINHSKTTTWSSGRGPSDSRRFFNLARRAINWGLFGCVAFAFFGMHGLSPLFWVCLGIVIWAAVWSLLFSPMAAKRHHIAAVACANEEKGQHSEYISEKQRSRAEHLRTSVL